MIEAAAIAVLSIYGFYIALAVITSFASGLPMKYSISFIEFLGGIIILCALISGWRIFAWVITNGPSKGIYISPVWWGFAALGASLSILSMFLLNIFQELFVLHRELGPALGLLQLGGLFLIPFAHLIIEAIWQRRIYKKLQPTDFAGS
jgi:hypothetical protein